MTVKEVRPRSDGAYRPPILFPHFDNKVKDDLREYVSNEIVKLAENGELKLTDLITQPPAIRAICEDVIHGRRVAYEDNNKEVIETYNIPSILSDYQIKIRSTNNKKLKWKKGLEPSRELTKKVGMSATKIKLYEPVYYEADTDEIELPPMLAWGLLAQGGKNIKRKDKDIFCEEIDGRKHELPSGLKKIK